ncbi:MAG: DUF6798 domain-containing protein [Pirellulaceae bacterium]
MSDVQSGGEGNLRGRFSSLAELWVYLCLLFLCASSAVPGINESHYLPKAKHLWDSSFAPGDLFLESHDSHFLTSMFAGLLARWLPLAAVAWLGRLMSWLLLAWSWQRLRRSLDLSPVVGALALAGWLLAVHYGNWAGEWVVGGFEAKTIAYPLVLLGLASMIAGKWQWVWLWMGAAMAWHPLVGGWAGLGAGLVWLFQPDLPRRLWQQLPWLAGGAALGIIGVLPALSGLSGPDVVDRVSAAQVHVYLRLPHHLSPQLFAGERHWAAAINLTVFIAVTVLLWRTNQQQHSQQRAGAARLLRVAWLAVIFALIGLAIDGLLSQDRPDIAARLLRFYWFRWSDVVVPLASLLLLWQWLARENRTTSDCRGDADTRSPTRIESTSGSKVMRAVCASFVSVLTVVGLASQLHLGPERTIPAADRLVVESVGRNVIDSDRYVDWLAVCEWIRESTPPDSLWLTPKYQQSFKWHAQRAEVVCWKDVPQDNASVIEWYHRMEQCAPPRADDGSITNWTTEELLDLSRKYGFRWVLLDRSYQSQPPALEIMYPVIHNGQYIDNRSFAVMRIPEALLSEPR